MNDLSEIRTYYNIPVMPYTELLDEQRGLSPHCGGPIWPNWDTSTDVRHLRWGGIPKDKEPSSNTSSTIETITEKMYWCGPIVSHFGHQIADFSSRIPMYDLNDQQAFYCFGVHPKKMNISSIDHAPIFFKEILDWYGISKDKVFIVNKPVIIKELQVVPQQEEINKSPTKKYLEVLDTNLSKKNFYSNNNSTYYISKAAFPRGKIAGEAYLEYILGINGVHVIRPEAISLNEQLRIYATADKLIFCEGSALHTTQLLGNCLQSIYILKRRSDINIAHKSLSARAKQIHYINIGLSIDGLNQEGNYAPYFGITIPNEIFILEFFDQLGLKINNWSSQALKVSIEEDIKIWFQWLKNISSLDKNQFELSAKSILLQLNQLGYYLD